MRFSFLLLPAGFLLLIESATKMIDVASSIVRRFNIPNIVIGLTTVSPGTSPPKLVVSILASVKHELSMLGNVPGWNIFIVLMTPGVLSLMGKLKVKRNAFPDII